MYLDMASMFRGGIKECEYHLSARVSILEQVNIGTLLCTEYLVGIQYRMHACKLRYLSSGESYLM
jgi:hypothetical protein